MSKLILPYDIVNNTPADAVKVEANFNRVETHANQELLERDGSVAMRAQLKLVDSSPLVALDAASKGYVDSLIPIGVVLPYAGTAAPPGGKWALANGASLEVASWPDLFAVLGYSHGGSGGNFNLPDMRGRMAMGPTPGAVGATGGSRDAVVVTHTHDVDATTTGAGEHAHLTSGTTTHQGDHVHGGEFGGGYLLQRGDAVVSFAFAGGFGFVSAPNTAPGGGHSHTFSNAVSNTASNHTHSIDTVSAAPAGAVAGTDQNLPPYRVLEHIVKVA